MDSFQTYLLQRALHDRLAPDPISDESLTPKENSFRTDTPSWERAPTTSNAPAAADPTRSIAFMTPQHTSNSSKPTIKLDYDHDMELLAAIDRAKPDEMVPSACVMGRC